MMFRAFPVLLVGLFGLASAMSVSPQQGSGPAEASPAFGWSLIVDPSDRAKRGRPRRQLPVVYSPLDREEIRVETDLVLNAILVFDKGGATVKGLRPTDFTVREDGREQEIAVFTDGARDIPRSIILIIDHSLSQLRHIEMSIEAAKVLIDSMKELDKMAIVTDNVELLADYTSDKTLLKERLDSLKQKAVAGDFGDSKQYSALMAALREKSARDGTRQIIIFQTDGDEFSSLSTRKTVGFTTFTFDEVAEAAESKGATVYTVYTGTVLAGLSEKQRLERVEAALNADREIYRKLIKKDDGQPNRKIVTSFIRDKAGQVRRDEDSVDEIAARTGGLAQSMQDSKQAFEIYDRILSDIDRRYVIGYYPTNQARDGKERDVKIAVSGRSGCKVMGRRSYVAAFEQPQ